MLKTANSDIDFETTWEQDEIMAKSRKVKSVNFNKKVDSVKQHLETLLSHDDSQPLKRMIEDMNELMG